MKLTNLALTGALLVALAGTSAVAQDARTIAGVPVPAEELDAVSEKCAALLAETQMPAAEAGDDAAAEAPAAGASDDPSTTESAAEEPVDPAVPANEGGNMAADAEAPTETPATIDLATLTPELCEAGGFSADHAM